MDQEEDDSAEEPGASRKAKSKKQFATVYQS
jgi:hypothetical protein